MTKIGYVARMVGTDLFATNRRSKNSFDVFAKAKVFGRKEDIANANIRFDYDIVPVSISLLPALPSK